MTKQKAQIIQKLRELSRQDPIIVPAKVISVDENEVTCQIEINELTFKGRLSAAESSEKGFVIIPAVGSWVLAGRLDENGDMWTILAFTQVDSITMRGGDNGGIPIGSSIKDKLNALEQDLNSLKQVFTTWAPVAQDGGSALKTAAATWAADSLTLTQTNDIEDPQIIH